MNEQDPILNDLWGDAAGDVPDVDFGTPYGVGTWADAILMEVDTIVEDNQYGYRLKLVFNLKGEEGMKYTGRLNLPRTIEENGDTNQYERTCKGNERTRNNVAGLLLGADLLRGKVFDVNSEESYEKMTNIFRHGVGRNMPVRVKVQQKFDKEQQAYVNTDFTELVAIKSRKK